MFPHQKLSSNFAPCALACDHCYTSIDVTSIISIRAHADNTWVIERLKYLGSYYDPQPIFLIVDFGSAPEFSKQIKSICEECNYSYIFIQDNGVFSLSIARNEGALAAKTDLLYFTDIDFFSVSVRYADDHDFRAIRDIVLNLPAYHLNYEISNCLWQTQPQAWNKYLEQTAVILAENSDRETNGFIAPYSNNFLCTKDFFQIVGGYDSSFRGHGSEDFELMIRIAYHSQHIELPDDISTDIFKPTSNSFYQPRPYKGFRRLGEAASFSAESNGFKAFHLWHPCSTEDPWRQSNDWNRSRLHLATGNYSNEPKNLGAIDFLQRKKTAICICKDPEHYGYFLPYRILGYSLQIISKDDSEEIQRIKKAIIDHKVDAFFIFNPYMKSHAEFYPLFLLAKEQELEVVVVERGALPSSIYYASDVSYNDPDFTDYDRHVIELSDEQLTSAEAFCVKIRTGEWVLEKLNSYQATIGKHSVTLSREPIKIFIPLQLEDDMAVTKFVNSNQIYSDFESTIHQVALNHPEFTFVVKAHPLKRNPFVGKMPNLLICENNDNVHAMIDLCDFTVCYNSGVGLLSLVHGKPTVTIGNAFYNVKETGHSATSFQDAITMIQSGECSLPCQTAVKRLVAWLVTRKYSFFKADDLIREFTHRNSHGYQNIMVSHFNWNGISMPLGRISATSRITESSYVNGRLSLSIGIDESRFLMFKGPKPRGMVKKILLSYVKQPLRKLINRRKTAV